ncbi:MAG: hypothetical protein HY319_19470 [Armatimonadetes bacterium]|nr:hypothetical protein [Armatimonadota bacterium]
MTVVTASVERESQASPVRRVLRIGLLLDSLVVPAWKKRLLEEVIRSPWAEMVLVVLNAADPTGPAAPPRQRFLYRAYSALDRRLFRGRPDAFAPTDLRPLLEGVQQLCVTPRRTRFSDYFPEPVLEELRALDLDVLIRLGFRILRGELLATPRFGVWSIHHGDNRVNRGGPPGFWETVGDWPLTGSVVQILSEDLDNGRVLARSWTTTDSLSVQRNKNVLYWNTAYLLPRCLEKVARTGSLEETAESEPGGYDGPLYQAPDDRAMLPILLHQGMKLARHGFRKTFFRNQWFLLYHFGKFPLSFRSFRKLVPPPDRFWADPFVVHRDGRHYIFFEEYRFEAKKGHISLLEIDPQGGATAPIRVIEEPFHLSYPFLFAHAGQYYMLPEAAQGQDLTLYVCREFPHSWSRHSTLIRGLEARDPTLHFHQGRWWLFVNLAPGPGGSPDSELHLFSSETLAGGRWVPHPKNPVITDASRARPAGRIFWKDGQAYRPSQNCSHRYGYGFNLSRIDVLDEQDYSETLVSRVEPRWDSELTRTHTFNFDGGLFVIDGCRYSRKPAGKP